MEKVFVFPKRTLCLVLEKEKHHGSVHQREMLENIFYVKSALGKDGQMFGCIKIRTMQPDAEELFVSLIESRGMDGLGKVNNDPRVTCFGNFLRRYWLDEIPQFYHILTRKMRLVGIRPKSEKVWKLYPRELQKRALRYRPGLMGVHYAFPGNSLEDIARAELDYLDKREHSDSPTLVDIEYCLRILYGFFFQGLRSH